MHARKLFAPAQTGAYLRWRGPEQGGGLKASLRYERLPLSAERPLARSSRMACGLVMGPGCFSIHLSTASSMSGCKRTCTGVPCPVGGRPRPGFLVAFAV